MCIFITNYKVWVFEVKLLYSFCHLSIAIRFSTYPLKFHFYYVSQHTFQFLYDNTSTAIMIACYRKQNSSLVLWIVFFYYFWKKSKMCAYVEYYYYKYNIKKKFLVLTEIKQTHQASFRIKHIYNLKICTRRK